MQVMITATKLSYLCPQNFSLLQRRRFCCLFSVHLTLSVVPLISPEVFYTIPDI